MKNQNATSEPTAFKKPDAYSRSHPSAGSVKLFDSTWEESCDECAHQEGRHYCLLHSVAIKNMDTVRCSDFKSQYSQNTEEADASR
jgi:hypothetical protein